MKRETTAAGFWLVFSGYVAWESYRLGLSALHRPGPGFFPFIAATGIALIAASRLIAGVRAGAPDENSVWGMAGEAKLVLGVIAGMIAYALLLDVVGFFLCTFLLVAFYLKLVARRPWTTALLFAAAVALTSHLFFDLLLKAELPRGWLDGLI